MENFKTSQTKENLMRAFAGESQARNRYTFSAEQAEKAGLHVVSALFKFTAEQEKVHGEIFYNHLKSESGENISVDGSYPVDISCEVSELLKSAYHNEYQEFGDVYPAFSRIARQEGFSKVAQDFENIAKIEKVHGDRFEKFRALAADNRLFSSDEVTVWTCLNCGYILESREAPEKCPVCGKDKGYYIRMSMTPLGEKVNKGK
jgi:rubrerythrin